MKKIHDLNISKYTMKDIRGIPDGPTRHLVKIPSDQLKEIPEENFAEVKKEEAWIESDGCENIRDMFSFCIEKTIILEIPLKPF
jgi:hypothetical protein